jgi:hypothetical protein
MRLVLIFQNVDIPPSLTTYGESPASTFVELEMRRGVYRIWNRRMGEYAGYLGRYWNFSGA